MVVMASAVRKSLPGVNPSANAQALKVRRPTVYFPFLSLFKSTHRKMYTDKRVVL